MIIFEFISLYAWSAFIVANMADIFIIRQRSKIHIEADPSLAAGYKQIEKALILWGNVPWILMAYDIHVGGVLSIWSYLRPLDGDPYVLGWYATLAVIWLLGLYWLYFKNGAQMLVDHPGVFFVNFTNPVMVKLIWFLGAAIVLAVIFFVSSLNVQVPAFR